MGLGVVIILALVLSALLLGGTAVLALIVWLLTRKRFPRLWPLLLAAPILMACLPPGLLAANLAWSNLAPPPARFQAVFGRLPDSNIHDLHAAGSGTTDAEEVFLAFRANGTGLARFVGPRFKPVGQTEDLVPMPGDDPPPGWWTADRCAVKDVRLAKNLRVWDEIVVTRCTTDGRVYVQARWVQ